jgi:hypothetical protein
MIGFAEMTFHLVLCIARLLLISCRAIDQLQSVPKVAYINAEHG